MKSLPSTLWTHHASQLHKAYPSLPMNDKPCESCGGIGSISVHPEFSSEPCPEGCDPFDGLEASMGNAVEKHFQTPMTEIMVRQADEDDDCSRAIAMCRRFEMLISAYRRKMSNDGMNGRRWDASEHLKAEQEVYEIEASLAAFDSLRKEGKDG